MSLNTWKKEFYPVEADDIAVHGTVREVIAHSLLKWKGALPENIKKHHLRLIKDWPLLRDRRGNEIPFDADTCSLCERYYRSSFSALDVHPCAPCPIYKSNARKPCHSAYGKFEYSGDPTMMINLLERTLKWEIKRTMAAAKRRLKKTSGTLV